MMYPYMPLEQALLIFLRQSGINAAPLAPATPAAIKGEYVTVSRIANSTDTRTRSATTTLIIDCYSPTQPVDGTPYDFYSPWKLARKVEELFYPFMEAYPWVRKLGTINIVDSSDDRFGYYTITVTYTHQT